MASQALTRSSRSARPGGVRKRGRRLRPDDFPRDVRDLVKGLNRWGAGPGTGPWDQQGWRELRAIVTAALPLAPFRVLPRASIRRFNWLMRATPVFLQLVPRRHGTIPTTGYLPGIGYIFAIFWRALQRPEIERLKQCERCERWFLDCTRNKSALRCSARCTSQWWNRARRKKARHAQYRV
jgi:hypothetical protein